MESISDIRIVKAPYRYWVLLTLLPVLAIFIWACFGTIYTEVSGQVIILPAPDKVEVVTTKYNGIIQSFNVNAAQKVKKGDVIAITNQHELKFKLDNKKKLLARLESEKKYLVFAYNGFLQNAKKYQDNAYDLTQQRLADLKIQKAYYRQLFKGKAKLHKGEFISLVDLKNTEIDLFGANERTFTAKDEYNKVLISHENIKISWIERLNDIDARVTAAREAVNLLAYQYDNAKYIRSPMTGVIDQILVPEGQNIQPGQSIASISTEGKAEYALAFLPATKGKRVKPFYKAYVSPGTVNKNIYGYILGSVEKTQEYQSSIQALNAILVNQSLAAKLEQKNLDFVAWIRLEENKKTKSGLRWTSNNGPPYDISPGTLGSTKIVVSKIHPIELLLPTLKTFFDAGERRSV